VTMIMSYGNESVCVCVALDLKKSQFSLPYYYVVSI